MRSSWKFEYPSQRMPVFARNVVATSQPLAAQAGLQMLINGGNAVDAALAEPDLLLDHIVGLEAGIRGEVAAVGVHEVRGLVGGGVLRVRGGATGEQERGGEGCEQAIHRC